MSSLCLRPRHQHSALWWHWRKRKAEKQRKAFIFVSPNLLQLYVRVQARTGRGGVAGERIAGAMAGCSMVAFFPFCGRTHRHTHTQTAHTYIYTAAPGGFPPGVPKWSNTTHHCLITPVPKDRRECFHEPRHRRFTVYHSGIVGHYTMLSRCVVTLFFKHLCVCGSRQREKRVMRSRLCLILCSFPRLFDGRFITSLIITLQWNLTAWFTTLCKSWRVFKEHHVGFLCLRVHLLYLYSSGSYTRPPCIPTFLLKDGAFV